MKIILMVRLTYNIVKCHPHNVTECKHCVQSPVDGVSDQSSHESSISGSRRSGMYENEQSKQSDVEFIPRRQTLLLQYLASEPTLFSNDSQRQFTEQTVHNNALTHTQNSNTGREDRRAMIQNRMRQWCTHKQQDSETEQVSQMRMHKQQVVDAKQVSSNCMNKEQLSDQEYLIIVQNQTVPD